MTFLETKILKLVKSILEVHKFDKFDLARVRYCNNNIEKNENTSVISKSVLKAFKKDYFILKIIKSIKHF